MPKERNLPNRKNDEATLNEGKISGAEIRLYLSGLDYTRSKTELLKYARSKKAPSTVLDYLTQFPEKDYTSPADVELEYRKLE